MSTRSRTLGVAAAIAAIAVAVPTAYADPTPTRAHPAPAPALAWSRRPDRSHLDQSCPTRRDRVATITEAGADRAGVHRLDGAADRLRGTLASNPDLSTFSGFISGKLNPDINIVQRPRRRSLRAVFAPTNEGIREAGSRHPGDIETTRWSAAHALLPHGAGVPRPNDVQGKMPTRTAGRWTSWAGRRHHGQWRQIGLPPTRTAPTST